ATVFVHDGQPGGAGFAERGFQAFTAWQTATRGAIEAWECVSGCPSCVQSPKCGNGNEPLDKDAAARLLRSVLAGAGRGRGCGAISRPPRIRGTIRFGCSCPPVGSKTACHPALPATAFADTCTASSFPGIRTP